MASKKAPKKAPKKKAAPKKATKRTRKPAQAAAPAPEPPAQPSKGRRRKARPTGVPQALAKAVELQASEPPPGPPEGEPWSPPEEGPILPNTPPPPTPMSPAEARDARRAARRAKRAGHMVERQVTQEAAPQPDMPAIVASSVVSLQDARRKRGDLEAAVAKELKQQKPIEVELDELDAYKLLHLAEVKQRNLERVRAPLVEKARQEIEAALEKIKQHKMGALRAEIERELARDADFCQAEDEHIDAINDVMNRFEPKLPDGFALTNISPEKRTVRASYSPTSRGARLSHRERKGA